MSGTRAFLVRRLLALLLLSAVAVTTLIGAYYGVSRNPRAVREDSAPAILQVAAAAAALDRSYGDAKRSLTGDTRDVEGLGEDYRTRLSTANQALAQAVKSTTKGTSARQSLLTVSGLVSSYADLIQQAYVNRDNEVLRDAYLTYAATMLRGDKSTILDRLAHVQGDQRRLLHEQTSFGWLLKIAWWVLVPVLFLSLAWLLWHTQRFLRHHFRRRFNPWLAVATALLLAVVPLAFFTSQTQDRLAQAESVLNGKDIGTAPGKINKRVDHTMDGTHWRTGAVGWIPLGGTALLALIVIGLQPRIDEYRFQPR